MSHVQIGAQAAEVETNPSAQMSGKSQKKRPPLRLAPRSQEHGRRLVVAQRKLLPWSIALKLTGQPSGGFSPHRRRECEDVDWGAPWPR